jgi:hypothetical protein
MHRSQRRPIAKLPASDLNDTDFAELKQCGALFGYTIIFKGNQNFWEGYRDSYSISPLASQKRRVRLKIEGYFNIHTGFVSE